jgi:transcriptional regulator with XRE-family HTH domain
MPDVLFPSKKEKENIKNTIPLNGLWKIRKSKGIKQNSLAKMMGCSPSYLSKIEKGIQNPNDKFKKKCAKMLRVKEIDLFPQN